MLYVKNYKTKVEHQSSKKIKIVKSDRDGKHYGKYDETGQKK